MTIYASFKINGGLFQVGNLKKDLAEIKAIKEKNGVTVFVITENQHELLRAGQTAHKSGGVVTVTAPSGWLNGYKANKINEQLSIGKNVYKDKDMEKGASYKASMKNYYTNTVQSDINAATDKAGVDSAVKALDWNSV